MPVRGGAAACGRQQSPQSTGHDRTQQHRPLPEAVDHGGDSGEAERWPGAWSKRRPYGFSADRWLYWYGKVFDNDLGDQIDEHTFLVVDTCNAPTPAVVSMDSMIRAALGVRGVLTNGGTRDSD
jgi:hypothetical protein